MNETQIAETHIELTGWKAVVGLALVLAFFGIRVALRFPAIPDEGREALRAYLVKDYEGRGPAAVAQILNDYHSGLSVHLPDAPAVAPQVEFVSLQAHGGPQAMIVRAEVTVNGAPPSDNRPVRYLHLMTKFGGGWMVSSDSDAYNYYEALAK